jgi:hypothetical protein
MLEHSELPLVTRDAARRRLVRIETAEQVLTDRGYVVYRGIENYTGSVRVFCRIPHSAHPFQTRLVTVSVDEIDHRLKTRL